MAPHRLKPLVRRSSLSEAPPGTESLNLDLTAGDLGDQLQGHKVSALFLGRFENETIMEALARFGILQRLHDIGYPKIEIAFQARGPFEYLFSIHDRSATENQPLGEIVLKEGWYTPKRQYLPRQELPPLQLLSIEWILMQHVRGRFSPGRQRLPGQNYPGLGVGHQVTELLIWVTNLMRKEGLINVPGYFHNAIFYSKWFKFIDPQTQGAMEAIRRDLAAQGCDLVHMSFAAYFNCLVDARRKRQFRWEPQEQVLPLSHTLKAYFADPEYERLCAAHGAELLLTVDWPQLQKKMARIDELEW